MHQPPTATLDRMAASFATKPKVSQLSFAVEQPSTGFTWSYGPIDQPYSIASISKLYAVAIIMQLREEAALTLNTRIAELLGEDTVRGLVVHHGRDYGSAITVRELLSHTSGIPDYFEDKRADGSTFLANMTQRDAAWTVEDFLAMAREIPSKFAPSTPGKAQYSDTNFQLLGRIVEVVTSESYDHALKRRVLDPHGLTATWLMTPHNLDRFGDIAPIMRKRTRLHVPQTLASFPADGAVVSTSTDQLRFLRAFMEGKLFPQRYLTEMTAHWNSVFTPIDYGIGIMRYQAPRWQTLFWKIPPMFGHSGAFGNVLYYMPERDIYVVGTVNQMVPISLPYRLLMRLVMQFS